jgi:hypothetical protein
MHETGKQVIRELRACKLHLLGIRECRWAGCGKRITSTGETIAYSGRNDVRHVLVLFLSQIVELDIDLFSLHYLLHLLEHSIE